MKWNFIKYFGDIIAADGKKRRGYAITNLLYLAFSALCVWGLLALLRYNDGQMQNCTEGGYVLFSWLGMLACIAGAIEFTLLGTVGQIILLLCSLIATFHPEKREGNLPALLISALSLLVFIVAACIFLF